MPDLLEMDELAHRGIRLSPPSAGGQHIGFGPGYYESIRPHLRHPSFIDRPELAKISVYDSGRDARPEQFANSARFETHLAESPKPDTRVVSICCQNSMRPLGITESALRTLMDLYDADDAFLDLAVSFGDKPRSSDAGHGAMNVKQKENGAYDMYYLFTYAEDYVTMNGTVSWTIRQVGVFHRFEPSGKGNLWILLHASPQTKLQQHLEQTLSTRPEDVLQLWSSLHLMILFTYLGNWRWYIRHLGDGVENSVDLAFTLDLSKSTKGSHTQSLIQVLQQQYLGDKLEPLPSSIGVALTTLQRLDSINSTFRFKKYTNDRGCQMVADQLAYHINALEGHLKSINVLEKKLQGISDLLAVALPMENNNKMLMLTNESLDENATIRVVTLVTLIYLPASFVSTLLGMNLFDFSGPEEKRFLMSDQIWIFFVIAVPLTLLTLGMWWCLTRRRLRTRQLEFRTIV